MSAEAPELELAARLEDAHQAEAALESEAALRAFEFVRARAGNTPLGRQAARGRADLLLKLGRNEEAVAAFDALIADCEACASAALGDLAGALAERAHVAYRSGDGPGIAAFGARAVEVARRVGEPAGTAHALRYLGIAHEFAGRYAEAEATYLTLLDTAPDTRHLGPVCNSLGEIARASGRFREAVTWYRRAHEEWVRKRADEPDIVTLNNLGAALVELGEHAEGGPLLERAIAEQRRSGHLAMLSETYHYRGLSHLMRGELAQAARDAVEGYLLASEYGETEMMGLLSRLLARIRSHGVSAPGRALAEGASPKELAHQSIALLTEAAKPSEIAKSRWLLGEILAAQGEHEAADLALSQAHREFVDLGLAYWADCVARAMTGTRTLVPKEIHP